LTSIKFCDLLQVRRELSVVIPLLNEVEDRVKMESLEAVGTKNQIDSLYNSLDSLYKNGMQYQSFDYWEKTVDNHLNFGNENNRDLFKSVWLAKGVTVNSDYLDLGDPLVELGEDKIAARILKEKIFLKNKLQKNFEAWYCANVEKSVRLGANKLVEKANRIKCK